MSPSLSPITQVRKCSLNLLIQHLTFSGGIFLIQNITILHCLNCLQGSSVYLMLLDFSGLQIKKTNVIMHYHFLLWMLEGKHSNVCWHMTSDWTTQHRPNIYMVWENRKGLFTLSLWIVPRWSFLTLQWFVTDFCVEFKWLDCATLFKLVWTLWHNHLNSTLNSLLQMVEMPNG